MSSLLKKGLFIIGFVLIYFVGIREVRKVIHEGHFGTVFPEQLGSINDELRLEAQSSVSFTLLEVKENNGHGWQYKMPFGSFFLFAILGLILLGANRKDYTILSLIHIIGGIISFLFVLLGINIGVKFLIIPDLLSRYLIPVSSLGFVALTYLQKNSRDSDEK
tara:strand:- start:7977 stop:8465 length:489 start_codon:yes stop_codon:yes gene_type:complete